MIVSRFFDTAVFSSGAPFCARFSQSHPFGPTLSGDATSAVHRLRRRWPTAATGGPYADEHHIYPCFFNQAA